jgi:hypothetical protein
MMNPIVKASWSRTPPNIYAISEPLPNAPHVSLSGGGTARMSLEDYLKALKKDLDNQTGKYFAYVMGSKDKEEADTFILQTWDVYTSPTSCYEALIHLYYAPINEYLCLKKHMGEYWAQKYLDEINARDMAISAITNALVQEV